MVPGQRFAGDTGEGAWPELGRGPGPWKSSALVLMGSGVKQGQVCLREASLA